MPIAGQEFHFADQIDGLLRRVELIEKALRGRWMVADACGVDEVRAELRAYADRFPLAGRALAEIERLRSVLVDVIASSDMQPCLHARIATEGLRAQLGKSGGGK